MNIDEMRKKVETKASPEEIQEFLDKIRKFSTTILESIELNNVSIPVAIAALTRAKIYLVLCAGISPENFKEMNKMMQKDYEKMWKLENPS